ncbi:unnamed protein product [Rotaria sp. Silwood2]|nr:unnamed protein product [Rotaria sp. Silwood2]CAF3898197.1 unnamed protein product [Rotaria sp. Silwood2]
MTNEFNEHIEKFINSLTEKPLEIYYQGFDFSNVSDSRTQLTKFNYDKSKVSFLNLEMIADMFQVFTAVHSAVEENSSKDFCIKVPHRLSNTKSVGDALRIFGGYGKPYIVVVSIHDRSQSEELFENISKIENVTKMTNEQMQQCMNNNFENIRGYYFGTASDQEQATYENPIGEIVTKMNDSQRKSTKRTTPNIEQTRNRSDQRQVIDLDEIIENWVWNMWNRTKTKLLSHYKREELIVIINWKHVTFIQSNTHFYGSPPVRLPKSQILFRTNFNNNTHNEHSYKFQTERFTRSIFEFKFTQSLTKSQESSIIFRLPEEIVELGGGIKREQSIEFGQDTIKEYNMRWSVNTHVRVAPYTRTYAELNIDEEEFNGDFTVSLRFCGRITATIATRQSPNTYLKFIDGDIVQIIRETIENDNSLNSFEIFEETPPVVQFTMHGKCSFRYGIQQHVILSQESLESSSSFLNQNYISSIRSNYRPLRTQLASSNSPLHLHIDDDEQL